MSVIISFNQYSQLTLPSICLIFLLIPSHLFVYDWHDLISWICVVSIHTIELKIVTTFQLQCLYMSSTLFMKTLYLPFRFLVLIFILKNMSYEYIFKQSLSEKILSALKNYVLLFTLRALYVDRWSRKKGNQ